jgi:F0F1-type ATP synthase membrane subunit b/b'
VFTTTLTLEERIARVRTQLAKAKENCRKACENSAKAEKKVERLIAKRPAGKPEIVAAKPAAVQEAAPLP